MWGQLHPTVNALIDRDALQSAHILPGQATRPPQLVVTSEDTTTLDLVVDVAERIGWFVKERDEWDDGTVQYTLAIREHERLHEEAGEDECPYL